jgi:hypothetical protein
MVVAALFALTWLADIVPDTPAGEPSTSTEKAGLVTNPVQVLDLGLLLPAVCAIGFELRRDSARALALTPAALTFLAVTGMPITARPAARRRTAVTA